MTYRFFRLFYFPLFWCLRSSESVVECISNREAVLIMQGFFNDGRWREHDRLITNQRLTL